MYSLTTDTAADNGTAPRRPPARQAAQLDALLDHTDPQAVLAEAESILGRIAPGMDPHPVRRGLRLLLDIYQGRHPAYQACNTYFHDLRHCTDTFLATARLLHGAFLAGERWDERALWIGLISALFHDAGYIQEVGDKQGTGARYTLTHVRRSMAMVEGLRGELGMNAEDAALAGSVIELTEVTLRASDIDFPSDYAARLARVVSSADLLAQASERDYLEKLLYLYHEFEEGGVKGFDSELDLLQKTPGFFEFLFERLEHLAPPWEDWLDRHFLAAHGLEQNLYSVAIQRHQDYLKHIIRDPHQDPRAKLRRRAIVADVRWRYHRHAAAG